MIKNQKHVRAGGGRVMPTRLPSASSGGPTARPSDPPPGATAKSQKMPFLFEINAVEWTVAALPFFWEIQPKKNTQCPGLFASLCACGRSVVSVCGSRSVIELVGLWSPWFVGGDTFQSSSVIITMKAVLYNTLRHGSRSPFALGRRSHIGALRNAFRKLQRQGRAGDCAYVHDEG